MSALAAYPIPHKRLRERCIEQAQHPRAAAIHPSQLQQPAVTA